MEKSIKCKCPKCGKTGYQVIETKILADGKTHGYLRIRHIEEHYIGRVRTTEEVFAELDE